MSPRARGPPPSQPPESSRRHSREDFSSSANVPLSAQMEEQRALSAERRKHPSYSGAAARPLATPASAPPYSASSAEHTLSCAAVRPADETLFSAAAAHPLATSPRPGYEHRPQHPGYSSGAAHAVWGDPPQSAGAPGPHRVSPGYSASAAQHPVWTQSPPSPSYPQANGHSPPQGGHRLAAAAAAARTPPPQQHHHHNHHSPHAQPEAFSASAFSPLSTVTAHAGAAGAPHSSSPPAFLGLAGGAAPITGVAPHALFRTPAPSATGLPSTPAASSSSPAARLAASGVPSPYESHGGYGEFPLSLLVAWDAQYSASSQRRKQHRRHDLIPHLCACCLSALQGSTASGSTHSARFRTTPPPAW